jgi:RNA polymerase sigma-B factor
MLASSLETGERFREYARTRDAALRDALVEEHFGLARALAGRFRGGSEPLEDLVQVAGIGLMKAVERFDPDFGTSFSTFATPTILGELKRHLRDRTWLLHVSRHDKEMRLRVRDAIEQAQHRLNEAEPPLRDVARLAGMSEAEALRGQMALHVYSAVPEDPTTAAVEVGADDENFEQVEAANIVRSLVDRLPPIQQEIVRAYYFEGRSQADISRRLRRSQMFVSRSLNRSRTQLRGWVRGRSIDDIDAPARRWCDAAAG